MTNETRGPIPIFISRHTRPLPEGYGSLVSWEKGEKAVTPKGDRVIIHNDELLISDEAPIINSARGPGRWVIEVVFEGEDSPCCVSAAKLLFPVEEMRGLKMGQVFDRSKGKWVPAVEVQD